VHPKWVDLLACPECGSGLALAEATERAGDAIVAGALRCAGCGRQYPIARRVPRFVAPEEDYADSFGWQWQRFHELQRDSYDGTRITRNRILARTGWGPEVWKGRMVLACGCGSGNDTEVLAALAGSLVSLDLSPAVDAMPEDLLARPDVLVLRADLPRAPLKPERFDVVHCHRVIQHTPEPPASFKGLARNVRPGGRMFLRTYDTDWRTRLHDRRLRRSGSTLSRKERYEYALVLTLDELTPEHDHPSSTETVTRWFQEAGFEEVVITKRRPVSETAVRPAGGRAPGDRAFAAGAP
jgi:SAM-dependent methyltransferase